MRYMPLPAQKSLVDFRLHPNLQGRLVVPSAFQLNVPRSARPRSSHKNSPGSPRRPHRSLAPQVQRRSLLRDLISLLHSLSKPNQSFTMSTRFAVLTFFALAALVSASPVPCETTTTITEWSLPIPTEPITSIFSPVPTIPVVPSLPITAEPLPTGISSEPIAVPPLSTVAPVSTVLPTIPTGLPPVSSVLPSLPIGLPPLPTISLPTISLPTISLPTITLPTISLPTASLPTVSLSTGNPGTWPTSAPATWPTSAPATWPTSAPGNAPTWTGSAPAGTPSNAPSGGNGNSGGQCNTGPIQCCNTIAQSNTPDGQQAIMGQLGDASSVDQGLLGGLLKAIVSGVNVPVGLNCSPITVLGIVGQDSCDAHPVCCENNAEGGLISIGCIPVSL
ncbi:fungal hydrophobin-domain-containing protein [Ganoderma leucocontextum]|nr:fungal hydrophobin-domain-containing protein [Ganoderma leucocontextum]